MRFPVASSLRRLSVTFFHAYFLLPKRQGFAQHWVQIHQNRNAIASIIGGGYFGNVRAVRCRTGSDRGTAGNGAVFLRVCRTKFVHPRLDALQHGFGLFCSKLPGWFARAFRCQQGRSGAAELEHELSLQVSRKHQVYADQFGLIRGRLRIRDGGGQPGRSASLADALQQCIKECLRKRLISSRGQVVGGHTTPFSAAGSCALHESCAAFNVPLRTGNASNISTPSTVSRPGFFTGAFIFKIIPGLRSIRSLTSTRISVISAATLKSQ